MILGVTLSKYAKLLAQGENAKCSLFTKKLLLKKSNKIFKTKDIENLTMSDFVDLERLLEESNFKDFCCIFVDKFWFQTVYVHNLELIIEDYGKQRARLFKKNYYIFDPPHYGEHGQETIGSELRKDFVNEFGNYVVLMDRVQKWDKTGYKKIEKWKVIDFFFWANYLAGQSIIENVK
jgi:hypothetical protein